MSGMAEMNTDEKLDLALQQLAAQGQLLVEMKQILTRVQPFLDMAESMPMPGAPKPNTVSTGLFPSKK